MSQTGLARLIGSPGAVRGGDRDRNPVYDGEIVRFSEVPIDLGGQDVLFRDRGKALS